MLSDSHIVVPSFVQLLPAVFSVPSDACPSYFVSRSFSSTSRRWTSAEFRSRDKSVQKHENVKYHRNTFDFGTFISTFLNSTHMWGDFPLYDLHKEKTRTWAPTGYISYFKRVKAYCSSYNSIQQFSC